MGTGDEPTSGPMSTVHRLRALVVDLHMLGADFARAQGLHATDLRALICLLDAERAGVTATPTWLGGRLHLNSASVTALLDRLEKSGHVRRSRDDRDRRKVRIDVTPDAADLGWSFFGPLITNATNSIGSYTPQQRETVEKFLGDMQDAIDAANRSNTDGRPSGRP